MKFETINGTLCRMVEPTPLTPEATFPCVVRLIQDDSPMGLCNRWKYSEKQDFLKKDWTISSLENNLNKVKDIHYSQFEIIGYPVEEGSAEWALWQAENGKSFEHKTAHHCRIFTMFSETELKVTNEEGEVVEFVDIDRFLSDGAKDGWQLYEPEPDYVICRRCGGSQSVPNPAVSNTAYTTCPKCGGTGYEIREQKPDDLYLNITPSNPADWCFDKKNFLVLVDDNFKRIVGENVTREQVGEIAKLLTEPAPQYKVGDWVTDGVVVGHVAVINDGKAWVKTQDAHYHLSVERLSKVDPSEVVIHIGCLSGTVEKAQDYAYFLLWPSKTDCDYSIIKRDALDTATRELVESLIKAQIKENA